VPRYLSIDVLRGVAILLMIQVHFVDNLSPREPATAWLYDISAYLGLIPAPLFTFVSGVSYCLWLRKQEATGRSETHITKITVRRGLFLFGTGIAFNALVWLPEDTFNWDVLTLIGSALLLLAFARNVPPAALALLCVMTLGISPLLRAAADYPAYWKDQSYSYDFTLGEVGLGFIANGYFPLFPWVIFPIVGFLVGDTLATRPGQTTPAALRWVWAIGVIFLLLAVMSFVSGAKVPAVIGRYYVAGFTMFPASTEYVVGTLGLCFVGLAALHRCLDRAGGKLQTRWPLRFLQRYSAFSLTVYLLHHAVHLWPLWIYGTMAADDPTHYWHQAMSTPAALGLTLAFIGACYGLLIVLERWGNVGFEAMLRWVCD
jgi:uncharacterized membrane protein